MPTTHDLTFVAPERRALVLRRIEAIERFIAKPGRAAAEAEAAKLGLRYAQFYNMVRAWRANPRPETVAGAGASRPKPTHFNQDQLELMAGIIADNGRARPNQIVDRIVAKTKALGIAMPDRCTIGLHVRRTRPSLLTDDIKAGFELLVDHTVLDMPVDFGDGVPRRPLATMVIDVAAEAIVGLTLSATTPNPATTAKALLDSIRGGLRHDHEVRAFPKRIGIIAHSKEETRGILETLRASGFDASDRWTDRLSGGLSIEALLGYLHARIRLRQRLVWNEGPRRFFRLAPGAGALQPEEAQLMVHGRLTSRHATTAFGRVYGATRTRLLGELHAISQEDRPA